MTRDGVWVIMHNPDVSTIYSGTGDVKELSFDEIERMHVARGSNADKFPGLKLVRFRNTSTSAKSIIATR